MSEARRLLDRFGANFDELYWDQKKRYTMDVIALCETLGYEEPNVENHQWWRVNNPQRYPFSLPDLARFIAKHPDPMLHDLYQYVSRTYANSMYHTDNDNIQVIIEYYLDDPAGLPELFWEGLVRDVDERSLARLGKLVPHDFVGYVLTRLFALTQTGSWGTPYLHLFHMYMTQRDDGYGDISWEYLKLLHGGEQH